MQYKGWTIAKGKKTVSGSLEVGGWLISKGERVTIAENKELAVRFIDNQEDKGNEP